MVRDLTVRILQREGYRTLCAADGEEALRIFDEHCSEIDLVLLDAVMPRRTGHEVYRHIRAECPGTKVLFSSGYDAETARSESVRGDGIMLLQKPFEPGQLLAAVRQVLDGPAPVEAEPVQI